MTSVFATGADEGYGYHLLNLLGSLRANSDVFDRVVAYDLGLSAHQRELLDRVKGVEVRMVPDFVPHWRQAFTWKPWIWTHLDAGETVFWLDAGATLVRSLAAALEQVRERGYFVVSQGGELRDIVPPDYFELYDVPAEAGDRPYVAAGIIGFQLHSLFYDAAIRPTYEDCLRGRNLGFSADDAVRLNHGLAYVEDPILRDCRHFRWDQTLLNIHLVKSFPDATMASIDEYAGVRSPREHPRQVIWAHRRQGSLSYLKRLPGSRVFGTYWQVRWWLKLHSKYFHSATYVWKARKIKATLRATFS
jgi:hypothetical protein